jgi:hypothetical protein
MPTSILDSPLSAIDVADVESFLSGVSGESLTWEGKATNPLPEQKREIRRQVCGFANQLGGLLIIGADQDKPTGVWSLPGVGRGGLKEDPHDWIARVISGGLREVPPFEVRCFTRGEQVVALIRVSPAPEPPCMTIDGVVHQRVVGETLRVVDPRVLGYLIARGERARAEARRAATCAQESSWDVEADRRFVALGMSPIFRATDPTARLFVQSYRVLLSETAEALPLSPYEGKRRPRIHQTATGWSISCGTIADDCSSWRIDVGRDWTVSIRVTGTKGGLHHLAADELVSSAWEAGAALLRALVPAEDASRLAAFVRCESAGTSFSSTFLSEDLSAWRTAVRSSVGPHWTSPTKENWRTSSESFCGEAGSNSTSPMNDSHNSRFFRP